MKNTYQTKSGHKIEITVRAQFGLDLQGRRKSGGEKVVTVSVKLNGADHFAPQGLQKLSVAQQGCVAKIGDIGLDQDRLTIVESMIAEVRSEIEAHNDELTAHSAKLDALGTGDINKDFGAHC